MPTVLRSGPYRERSRLSEECAKLDRALNKIWLIWGWKQQVIEGLNEVIGA